MLGYGTTENHMQSLFFLTVHLTTLSVAPTIYRRMTGWLTNNELERIWKEATVVQFKYYPGAFPEGQIKTSKTSVRVAGLPAKIWNRYLLNFNQKCSPLYRDVSSVAISLTYTRLCFTITCAKHFSQILSDQCLTAYSSTQAKRKPMLSSGTATQQIQNCPKSLFYLCMIKASVLHTRRSFWNRKLCS
jgi:hypothetical protein